MDTAPPLKLVIVGAGGHGREMLAYVRDLAAHGADIDLLGVIDELHPPGPWMDTRVLGSFDALADLLASDTADEIGYITAIGDNRLRRRFVEQAGKVGGPRLITWTQIHPRAYAGPRVEIGPGSCVAPGVSLTTNVRIGRHCIVNVNASVSHDCDVGDFANINPGSVICGNVRIGAGAYIGAGSTVIEKIRIGEGAIIGAGAVVIRDVPACATVVGVPARVTGIGGQGTW